MNNDRVIAHMQKRSGVGDSPFAGLPTPEDHNQYIKHRAVKDILVASLLGAGIGVGARALTGSSYLFGTNGAGSAGGRNIAPQQVRLPIPVYKTPEEEEEAALQGAKRAEENGVSTWLAGAGGQAAQQKPELPWYLPLMVTGPLAAGAMGYGLSDMLLDRKRKKDLGDEVEASKQEYEQALLGEYDPARVSSMPRIGTLRGPVKAAEEVGQLLDELAERCGFTDRAPLEKAATGERTVGNLLGLYGAAALPLALLTGYAAHEYTRKRSPEETLRKALRQRQREQALRRPSDVVVVPESVHLSRGGDLRYDSPPSLQPPGGVI